MRHTHLLKVLLALVVIFGLVGCGGQGPGAGPVTRPAATMRAMEAQTPDYLTLTEDTANPLIENSADLFNPYVLYHNGQYLMWTNYETGGARFSTSSDGLQWSTPAPCVGLAARVKRPVVLFNSDLGQFEIWYHNNGNNYGMDGYEHAVSTDGLNWIGKTICAQYPAPHRVAYAVYSKNIGTYGPCEVFYNSSATGTTPDYVNPWNNRYVMYYHMTRQETQTEVTALAVSPNGLTWGVATENSCVLDAGPAGSWDSKCATLGSVFKDANGYHMYYGGSKVAYYGEEGIGYASSPDGVNWTKHPDPLLHISDGYEWRQWSTCSPRVVFVNGEARMYFSGRIASYVSSLGLAYLKPATQPTPPAPADTTAPVVTLADPNPATLLPPEGQTIDVTVVGNILEEGSGLAAASLQLVDEYGALSSTIDLTARVASDGSFSVTVPLVALRNGNDSNGRSYTFSVTASDVAGNASEAVQVTAVVPHSNSGGNGNGNGWGRKKK